MKILIVFSVLACVLSVSHAAAKPKPPPTITCNDPVETMLLTLEDQVAMRVEEIRKNVSMIEMNVNTVAKALFCVIDGARKIADAKKGDVTSNSGLMAFFMGVTTGFTAVGVGQGLPSLEASLQTKLVSSGLLDNSMIEGYKATLAMALTDPRANVSRCFSTNKAALTKSVRDYMTAINASVSLKTPALYAAYNKTITELAKDKNVTDFGKRVAACAKNATVIPCVVSLVGTNPSNYPILGKLASLMPFSGMIDEFLANFNNFNASSLQLPAVQSYISCLLNKTSTSAAKISLRSSRR